MEAEMTELKHYLQLNAIQLRRCDGLFARYRRLAMNPEHCAPMVIVNLPEPETPSWEERLADPLVMLRSELDELRQHMEIGDDRVPSVRVEFGTPQVAAAFGCEIFIPSNNLPAAGSHVLKRAEDIYQLPIPALDAGWYGKLAEWTEVWKANLPRGVVMQLPDIQSPFNSAHLIRGNDIFLDFFDHPAELDLLLDKVTNFMIRITRHMKAALAGEPGWFMDWGAYWKGYARISNCSMHMISPAYYRQHVLERDVRFFEAVGGGRVHYCGTAPEVIDDFFKIPGLSGLDVDCALQDFWDLCDRAPRNVVLMPTLGLAPDSPEIERLLSGDWPRKRNIIIVVSAASIEEGRDLLGRLRASIPGVH